MVTVSIQYYKFDKLNPSNEYLLGSEYTKNIDEILVPLNEKHSPFLLRKHLLVKFVRDGKLNLFSEYQKMFGGSG